MFPPASFGLRVWVDDASWPEKRCGADRALAGEIGQGRVIQSSMRGSGEPLLPKHWVRRFTLLDCSQMQLPPRSKIVFSSSVLTRNETERNRCGGP